MNSLIRASLIAAVAAAGSPAAQALTVTHQVRVQPYQVCYAVAGCSDMTSFTSGAVEAFADQIFGLAGLDVQFLPLLVLNTTPAGDISDHLRRFPIEAGFGDLFAPGYVYPAVVPAFFDSQFAPPGTVGLAWLGNAGLITHTPESVETTFAHELGHNLGLFHYFDSFPGTTDNLMDYGCDVVTGCSLAATQIAELRASFESNRFSYVYAAPVPEPGAFGLMAMGLLGIALRRRVGQQPSARAQ